MTPMRSSRRGMTLVEIMIVVLIIGVLLSIAVPQFIQSREVSRHRSCLSNLKKIEEAKAQLEDLQERARKSGVPRAVD